MEDCFAKLGQVGASQGQVSLMATDLRHLALAGIDKVLIGLELLVSGGFLRGHLNANTLVDFGELWASCQNSGPFFMHVKPGEHEPTPVGRVD